jgi:cell division protein FtsA
MFKNYICALDIGSSKISACLLEISGRQISNIFFETQASKGVKRGTIVDSVELVETVGRVLKSLRARSGIKIKAIHTNISGRDIITRHSRAIIPLAERGNKVVTSTDMENVREQAIILGSNIEEEIIHSIPFGYTVDSKSDISNPLGLYGHKLEVDLYLICGKLSYIQTLTHVINQAGCDVKELFFSGLATSEIVFNEELKSGINIICDIGSDIAELLVFKDGQLRDTDILQIGSSDLTQAISDSLNMPFELAEDIKINYGIVGDPCRIYEQKEILIKKDNIYKPIKQRAVCEIINAKAAHISAHIKESVIKNSQPNDIKHFILTGRAMLLEGFLELLEADLGFSVEFARITDPQINTFVNKNPQLSGRKYLTYLTALGLACKELYGYQPKALPVKKTSPNPVFKIIDKAKEVYQEYF